MHFPRTPPRPLFTAKEQQDAFDALGANCGPGAIAAMCGSTPRAVALLLGDEFRVLFRDFHDCQLLFSCQRPRLVGLE